MYDKIYLTSFPGYSQYSINIKPEHNYIGFTFLKVLQGALSVICTYFLYSMFIYGDKISILYISWPVMALLNVFTVLERLIKLNEKGHETVFEVAISALGFISHSVCSIAILYKLEALDIEAKVNTIPVDTSMRYISAASFSTIVSCIYLLDFILTGDALLYQNSVQTWIWPRRPNYGLDLLPNEPFRLVLPWETKLAEDFEQIKKIIRRRKLKRDDKKNKNKPKPTWNQDVVESRHLQEIDSTPWKTVTTHVIQYNAAETNYNKCSNTEVNGIQNLEKNGNEY